MENVPVVKFDRKTTFKGNEGSEREGEAYLYRFQCGNNEPPVELACFNDLGEDDEKKDLPQWSKKEVKQMKREWRQLHRIYRNSPVARGPFFTDLPQIEAVDLDSITGQ